VRTSLLRSCGLVAALGLLVVSSASGGASAATIDGQYDQTGPLGAGAVFNLVVLGRGGVPASGVGSVALNVTVTRPSATSFLTVWPTGQPRPNASNLNFVAGQTVPNMVIVPVGVGGQISIFNESGTTDVLVDVLGWFPAGPSFTGLTPARLLDSRVPSGGTADGAFSGIGRIAGGAVFDLAVSGRGGVPATGVGSVALNVTVARPTAASFVSVWPAGQPRPNASNLNFVAGQTVPNMVVVPLGAAGKISIFNETGSTDVLVDVLGWFPAGPSFTGLTPSRLVDTRIPSGGTVDGAFSGGGQLAGGTALNVAVAGRGGVPASGAGSVVLNVTVARPSAASFLTVWPAGQTRPNASNLNYTPGQTVANMVVVPIGANGAISIVNESGSTDVLVDVLGWFPSASSFTGLTPARLLDSRTTTPPTTAVSCPDSKTALSNPPGPNTFVVGDSLTYGEWCWAKTAASEYDSRELIARLDARVGRVTSTGVTIVKSVPASSLPSKLVFALGTNDLASGYSAWSYRQKLNDVIAYAGQNKNVHVYLITVRSSKNLTLSGAYNEQIVQAAVLKPNVHVVDWASQVTSSISASDGVHLTLTGYRQRAAYIASRVANCVNRADYAGSFCQ
jgi:hypothetical protein